MKKSISIRYTVLLFGEQISTLRIYDEHDKAKNEFIAKDWLKTMYPKSHKNLTLTIIK